MHSKLKVLLARAELRIAWPDRLIGIYAFLIRSPAFGDQPQADGPSPDTREIVMRR
ncbi:hypothetical protein [Bradyrhizobium sp. CCGE-LA001]|uniref:hypothetical protein n=1 Tax=Bradyrhizobium sp. CCGE-LA001 TaxID=1223566 RepID=UPI0003169DFE|nr:hypothetical protein [Bradyrhizobium sp. CCGE-LA001]